MKSKLIIVEGSQGVGKTSVTRMLREKMAGSNLFSLSGVNDNSEKGFAKCYNMHYGIISLIRENFNNSINFILDRSFISEKVYCDLGYKPYTFEHDCDTLAHFYKRLYNLYDVKYILLTANTDTFKDRLVRNKHDYQEFSAESSYLQQETYKKNLQKYKIKYTEISTVNKTVEEIVEVILGE